jgi:hypothetical protein
MYKCNSRISCEAREQNLYVIAALTVLVYFPKSAFSIDDSRDLVF